MSKSKVILLGLVLPGFLAEVISGNSPLYVFLNPLFSAFFILAYGLPFLLIRELAIRLKLSVAAILVLGLANGIFNEGIWLRPCLSQTTLFQSV
jgi:hypothetical protein